MSLLFDLLLLMFTYIYVFATILIPVQLKKREKITKFQARKAVHLFAGLAVLTAPYYFWPWFAVILAGSMAVLTLLSSKKSNVKQLKELYDSIGEEAEENAGYLQGPFHYCLSITILIAIFAGFQIVENRLLREDQQKRDKRVKQEKQLDDVILWAKSIAEWDNKEVMERVDRTVEDDNPLIKTLLLSMNSNSEFIRFLNNGVDVILPIAETFEQQSLNDSVAALIADLRIYLDLLGNEQITMMKDSAAGTKQVSKQIDLLTCDTIKHKRDVLPNSAQGVIKEATKLKLTI